MKCEFCRKKLNPYLLKQVYFNEDQRLVFEIECLGCRKYNYLGISAYFNLRKDFEMPTVKPINNKLPQNMNIIIVSNERCGISWIGKVISEVHNKMFGTTPEWNYEISRVIARKKHLPLPQGWSSVYDIDPEQLAERGFDRVLIIQRDLDTLLKVHTLYFSRELSDKYDDIRKESLIDKIKKNWELVYGKEINHPKCLKVRLEDLNSYTVATFNEILDFLNFPIYGRPIIVPVSPPDRNWEAYSSILPKGHELCNRLKEIDEAYDP